MATGPVDMPANHPSHYPPLKTALEIDEMPGKGDVKRFNTTLVCALKWVLCRITEEPPNVVFMYNATTKEGMGNSTVISWLPLLYLQDNFYLLQCS